MFGSKIINKALKVISWLVGFLLLILAAMYFIITVPFLQTKATHLVSTYLSNKLKAKIEIQSVDIEFFKTIVLEGVYVEDLNKDTLIYARKIKVDIRLIDLEKANISLRSAEIHEGKFYLKHDKDSVLNLQFILDAFSSEDTSASKPFTFNCSGLKLEDVSFIYIDFNEPKAPVGVDWWNIYAKHVYGILHDLKFKNSILSADIKYLALEERSGFKLKKLACNAVFSDTLASFENLEVLTEASHIFGNYSMKYDSLSDFPDYITKVYMKSIQRNSIVNMSDIAYFAPPLWGWEEEIKISGELRGTVDKLKGRKLLVETLGKTRYIGDIDITGLPDVDNTVFDFKIKTLQTNKAGMERIPLYPFTSGKHLELPNLINDLGLITFNGTVTGFLSDFVSFGSFSTAMGDLDTDVNLKFTDNDTIAYYSGKVKTNSFNLGKLFSINPMLGVVAMNTDVSGFGFTPDIVSAHLSGEINSFEFNSYKYSNLTVEGQVSQRLFSGSLIAKDPNLEMNFDGKIDFRKKAPVFDFASYIKKANLTKLNLLDKDSSATISASVVFNFQGARLSEFDGSARINNFEYRELGDSNSVKSLNLISSRTVNGNNLVLRSDLADGTVSGNFNIETLVTSVQDLLAQYASGFGRKLDLKKVSELLPEQIMQFDIDLKNTELISKLFFPEYTISAGSKISGSLNTASSSLSLNAYAPSFNMPDMRFNELSIKGKSIQGAFNLEAESEEAFISESMRLRDLVLDVSVKNDIADFRFQLANKTYSKNSADLKGRVNFGGSNLSASFLPSTFTLGDLVWDVHENNFIQFDSSSVNIKELLLQNESQQVRVNGSIDFAEGSHRANPPLKIELENFNLNSLDSLLIPLKVDLGGSASGFVHVKGSLEKPIFTTALNVQNMSFNMDTLGVASLNASYELNEPYIRIDATFGKENIKTIEVNGKYLLGRKEDNLDLEIKLQKTYLDKLARYFDSFAKDLKGIASGNLHLGGSFDKPWISGKLNLQKTSFVVEYLNTHYSLSDEIYFTRNSIEVKNLTINDKDGHTALVSGKLMHENFQDFRFDVLIEPNRFLCLNTNSGMNEIFYGTAYATGAVSIKGPLESIVMDVRLRSERGTQVFIPLSNPSIVGQKGFIHFMGSDTVKTAVPAYIETTPGLQLTMNLDITPDAEIQMIFDSQLGDIIKGRGTGNLKLEVSTGGDFQMFGEYVIEEGDYLFSFRNIINKRFDISNGSSIRWNGDPLLAEINLKAIYNLRAALYDLIPLDNDESLKRRRQVECHLNMTGMLLNPFIKFDVVIPDLDREPGNYGDLVKYYTSTEEQRTNQVMSLLILRRFYTPQELEGSSASNAGSGVSSSSMELLSNQLNNWVSQVSNKFDFGVNVGEEDFGASVGKSFLNDRVLVDGSVKYNSSASTTQQSQVVGDANAELKLSKDGKFRLKYFYKSSAGTYVLENDLSRQGVGFVFKTEFDNPAEMRRRREMVRLRKEFKLMEPDSNEK